MQVMLTLIMQVCCLAFLWIGLQKKCCPDVTTKAGGPEGSCDAFNSGVFKLGTIGIWAPCNGTDNGTHLYDGNANAFWKHLFCCKDGPILPTFHPNVETMMGAWVAQVFLAMRRYRNPKPHYDPGYDVFWSWTLDFQIYLRSIPGISFLLLRLCAHLFSEHFLFFTVLVSMPLLVGDAEPLDFTKDLFAIVFLTELDDINEKIVNLGPRGEYIKLSGESVEWRWW